MVESDPDCSVENPMFSMVDQPGIGPYLMPSSPLHFGSMARQRARPAPLLGEHTDEILADVLGLGDGEIAGLHDEKVVAGPV
jgi:2-methylfumaryl-CoA isomerase